jgi:hypothetical protein
MQTVSNEQRRLTITIVISILTIAGTLFAAYLGAYYSIQSQNTNSEQITAKILYDDLDRMNSTLTNYYTVAEAWKTKKSMPYIITPVYPANGVYYSVRDKIFLMSPSLSRNISISYSDLEWAEIYREMINNQFGSNNVKVINSTYGVVFTPEQVQILTPSLHQMVITIEDAYQRRTQIMNELENEYNIPKNPANGYNYYN